MFAPLTEIITPASSPSSLEPEQRLVGEMQPRLDHGRLVQVVPLGHVEGEQEPLVGEEEDAEALGMRVRGCAAALWLRFVVRCNAA